MPFYEYLCSRCGQHHEELQKVSDRPLRKCPSCGRAALKRLVSAPAFRLKGGGWYETDFKGEQDRKRNLAGEKEPAPAAEATAAKDDKKDAKAATEAKPDGAARPAAAAPAKPAAAKPRAKPVARKRPAARGAGRARK